MEIQNISGNDIIPNGLNINSRVSNENTQVENQDQKADKTITEEKKGNVVDTQA